MFRNPFIARSLKGFAEGESGMTLPLLALTFMTITGFIGTAVDIARLQLVQSRLSFALDAAGLAAGATLNTTDLNSEVAKYINVNYPAKYLDSTPPVITVSASENQKIINLSATTTLPTTFMNAFGISEMSVTASSEVTRSTEGLELVMALDNTGSMNNYGKLTALKSAATSLVNILYGDRTDIEKLWIGLVPFSQTVNIGTGYTSWINQTHLATLVWGPTSWQGCVDSRDANGRDVVDDPPSVETFKVYYSPSTDNRPYPYNTYTYINANKWITSRYADGSPKTFSSYIDEDLGPNAYCPQPVTPMTSSKSTILAAVNDMEARGNTHINLGAIWAWNMISPRWRGLWGGEMNTDGLPLDYGAEHMNKAVILLTDGENTMSQSTYTAFGYLSDGRLGSTSNTTTAFNTLNSKLGTVCSAMKNRGIYVYSIVLGTVNTTTRTVMRNCASAENYYFESPTSSELQSVFNAIADSLSNLRISK